MGIQRTDRDLVHSTYRAETWVLLLGGVCSYNARQIGRGLCIARRKVQYYTWLFRTSNSFEMQFIRNTKFKSGNSVNFMLNIQITKYNMTAKLDFSLTIIFNFTVFAKKTIPLFCDILTCRDSYVL